jgi:hypothetical protein
VLLSFVAATDPRTDAHDHANRHRRDDLHPVSRDNGFVHRYSKDDEDECKSENTFLNRHARTGEQHEVGLPASSETTPGGKGVPHHRQPLSSSSAGPSCFRR